MLSNDTMDLYRSTLMSWVEDPGVETFEGLSMTELQLDEAFVVAETTMDRVGLYSVPDNCYRLATFIQGFQCSSRRTGFCAECPYELQKTLRRNETLTLKLSSTHGATWRLLSAAGDYAQFVSTKNKTSWAFYSGIICELRPDLGEFGVYRLNVSSTACDFTTAKEPVNIYLPSTKLRALFAHCLYAASMLGDFGVYRLTVSSATCDFTTAKEPVNIYLTLLLAALVLGGVGLLCAAGSALLALARRKGKLRYGDEELVAPQRLRALDTFRGLTIVLMIFVNYGGGRYERWVGHATWNGLQLADVVFPSFVWIMGVCIPMSVRGVLARGVPRWRALLHIFRRSCLMFLIGVSLSSMFGANWLHSLRVMGVLQRLGLSYFLVASCCLLTTRKYFTHPRGACGQALKDVWAASGCWLLAAAALALHTFFTLRVHDPNCPPGYLGPGGRHDNWAVAAACTGGAAAYVDRLLLGADHIFKQLTAASVYGGASMDPENILGTLTTVVHVVVGVQAGATLQHYKGHKSRVARWLAWAAMMFLIGAILAGFSKEKGIIPVNKSLWSISFVLVTSALSGAALAACYLLTDVWRLWSGAPFHAPGRNAIFLFVGHYVCTFMFPLVVRVRGVRTHAAHLLAQLWATALWVAVAHLMARKNIFITL